ncbi:MAG: nicotinamide riboside transporter PnuC [Bacteroidetes bacterium]|jgi:nicotinamide mononucleotide transporter|nr:nicotinamide riboside transporter PnuC [Bacteroidota bacterium]
MSSSIHHKLIEAFAVVFSLAYTWMYLKGVLPEGYILAGLGAGLFAYLCWERKIYAESALQVFYIGMAGYGYNLISEGGTTADQVTLYTHAIWLSIATLGTVLLGLFLKHSTDASMPYLDAFTTIFSLVATWLMINLVHDNWLYWIVIDAVSIYLYAKRGLKLGSVLFALYLLLALDGYFEAIQIF